MFFRSHSLVNIIMSNRDNRFKHTHFSSFFSLNFAGFDQSSGPVIFIIQSSAAFLFLLFTFDADSANVIDKDQERMIMDEYSS